MQIQIQLVLNISRLEKRVPFQQNNFFFNLQQVKMLYNVNSVCA